MSLEDIGFVIAGASLILGFVGLTIGIVVMAGTESLPLGIAIGLVFGGVWTGAAIALYGACRRMSK